MADTAYLDSHLGPVDFVVVEFGSGARLEDGFGQLLELVDRHIIRVIDLEFVVKHDDGSITAIAPGEITIETDFDFSVFEGSSSGVLNGSDFTEIGADLQVGNVAAVLVYEELALLPVLASLEAGGARLLGEGSVDPIELDAALEAGN